MRYICLPHGIWRYCLSASQLMVYLAIARHSNRLSHCAVKYETLATFAGMSVSSVVRAVKQLQAKGLVTVDKRYNHQGNLIANRYYLAPISGNYTKVSPKIFSLGLNKSVFKVYVYLLKCREDKNLLAVPSLMQMASTLRMSKRTIVDAVALLHQAGMVLKTSYKRKTDGGNGHNRYTVLTVVLRKLLFALLLGVQKGGVAFVASQCFRFFVLTMLQAVETSRFFVVLMQGLLYRKVHFYLRI